MRDQRSMVPVSVMALTGAALTVAIGLTGCAADQDTEAPTPVAADQQVNGLPEGVTLPEHVPTEVANESSERSNVAIEACEAVDGGWRAAGTAVNTGDGERSYEVTVFFTTEAGTVIGYGSTSVPVGPSGNASWTIEEQFVAASPTACVLRGVAVS